MNGRYCYIFRFFASIVLCYSSIHWTSAAGQQPHISRPDSNHINAPSSATPFQCLSIISDNISLAFYFTFTEFLNVSKRTPENGPHIPSPPSLGAFMVHRRLRDLVRWTRTQDLLVERIRRRRISQPSQGACLRPGSSLIPFPRSKRYAWLSLCLQSLPIEST